MKYLFFKIEYFFFEIKQLRKCNLKLKKKEEFF